MLFLDRLT